MSQTLLGSAAKQCAIIITMNTHSWIIQVLEQFDVFVSSGLPMLGVFPQNWGFECDSGDFGFYF